MDSKVDIPFGKRSASICGTEAAHALPEGRALFVFPFKRVEGQPSWAGAPIPLEPGEAHRCRGNSR